MKKYITFIIAAVMLVLAACHPSQQPQGTTETPTGNSTASSETTMQTETKQPSTMAPTTQTTEPAENQWAAYNAWQDYMHVDTDAMVFQYDGELPDNPGFDNVDTSQMVSGCFYTVDFDLGEIFLIANEEVLSYCGTSEHIYFVLLSAPTKVYRSDRTGRNCTLIFESDCDSITEIRYYGVNSNGKLIVCENRANGDRIISYDVLNEEITVLMEAYLIGQFYFSPTSLSEDHVVKNISKDELGATIYWKGKLYKEDPDRSQDYTYYYFLETGEHWDVFTWEPRN